MCVFTRTCVCGRKVVNTRMQIRVCVFEVSVYMYTSQEDVERVERDGSGNGRVPSRGNNMSEDREVEMLVGGGARLWDENRSKCECGYSGAEEG